MHCYHCDSPILTKVSGTVDGELKDFCCEGCKGVSALICNERLDAFYQNKKGKISLSFTHQYPLEYYDTSSFYEEYIEHNTLTLYSPSIHCAACVFLIEKILTKLPEVAYVRVNLTEVRIRIELSGVGSTSNIIETLSSIGYSGRTIDENTEERYAKEKNKQMLKRIGFAFFAMMNMMWIAISIYTGADDGDFYEYFLILSFILATPTLFYSGFGFLSATYYALKTRTLTMDVPIAIGSVATYIYSCTVLFSIVEGEVYFDMVVNFIFIILVGRYLESSSRKKILVDNNALQTLDTKVMSLIKEGKEYITPTKSAKVGQLFRIKPGDTIATDGIVRSGFVSIDESLLSGESMPIEKGMNTTVYGGTIVTNGSAEVEITKDYNHSSFAKIKALVATSGLNKGKISCLIDSILPYFVITTISLAVLSFMYHFGISNSGFDFALMAAVSVLIITCPCAFGIAVPMTYYAANNVLFKNKVIARDNDIIENIHTLDTIVFDKTGTLTTAEFVVCDTEYIKHPEHTQRIAKSLCELSEHPLSRAIAHHSLDVLPLSSTKFTNYSGYGVSAYIEEEQYYLGSKQFISDTLSKEIPTPNADSSVVYVANKIEILGIFYLEDEINLGAKELITYLHSLHKRIVLLSGDTEQSVAKVAKTLGIDEYYSRQTPESKLAFISNEERALMIGDGLNDAPALKAATFSIAMSGLHLVETSVSAIVIKNNILAIKQLFIIAQKAKRTVTSNIVFALSYNLIFIPLAFLGLLNPIIAAIVMPISSLVVILNAMRLRIANAKNNL